MPLVHVIRCACVQLREKIASATSAIRSVFGQEQTSEQDAVISLFIYLFFVSCFFNLISLCCEVNLHIILSSV